MKRVIEIRAAEGGKDSALFVKDLAQAYVKMAGKLGWRHRLIDDRPGEVHISIEGDDLSGLDNEPGGHRIQRVPPTERKGRVHTSTVTVAVVDPRSVTVSIDDKDLKVEWFSGTGAGGQYRNKHQNSARITHIPTGVVATAQCRSRQNSYAQARATIEQVVCQMVQREHHSSVAHSRKQQVGSGMRGDKIRTYRFQDGIVKDHVTGKSSNIERVMSGNFDLLW